MITDCPVQCKYVRNFCVKRFELSRVMDVTLRRKVLCMIMMMMTMMMMTTTMMMMMMMMMIPV